MINRVMLPVAGSSMSVWNIALMCFQVILLGGYIYVHYLPKLVGYKNYLKLHIIFLAVSVIITFLFFKKPTIIVNTNNPTMDIIYILITTIGVPFFLLSTSSTNFQRWYNLIYNEPPYHLYSVSNTGNVIAVIGYVIIIESLLGLNNQIFLFNSFYAMAAVFSIIAALNVYKRYKDDIHKESEVKYEIDNKVSTKIKLYWLMLSFVPNALMIAANTLLGNYLNANSIHFFWIIPLVIFLFAYIIAFSKIKLLDINTYERITLWLCIIILIMLFIVNNRYTYVLAMLGLFMICLVCNLYLVQNKPIASNLTEFYLYISIGGALGGVFSSLISPLLFNNIYEFPLIIILFLLLMYTKHKKERVTNFSIDTWEYEFAFLLTLFILIMNGISNKPAQFLYLIIIVVAVLVRRLYMSEKTRFNSILILIIITFIFNYSAIRNVEFKTRNFYGIKTVTKSEYTDEENNKHEIVNLVTGNTLHGSQFASGDEMEFEAISYYDGNGSTIGRFLRQYNNKIKTVGIVGLGIGTLSALSNESQEWKYFEIDPQVIEIAQDEKHFTIFNKFNHEVIRGDARITLQFEEHNYYDVIVLDAYSGDLIPASLLTKEAIELYKSKLKDDGILIFHISNMQYNLRPVLSTAAKDIGMNCYVDILPSESEVFEVRSEWALMTNNKDFVSEDWKEIEEYSDFKLWTDDKHSTASVLR